MRNFYSIACKWLGHKWTPNFVTLPSKRICRRCKAKQRLAYKRMRWSNVTSFIGESRNDEELLRQWPASSTSV